MRETADSERQQVTLLTELMSKLGDVRIFGGLAADRKVNLE